jgi:nicotinate-nucleotide adenylyltransferase
MKIGLYFGSFNPIHVAHLIISNHILNETTIERIWFIVSPQNPFKNENTLLNEYHRLHLVRLAIDDDPRMRVSDIEFGLPRPSYTINTLTYLTEKYPEHEFSIIMGSDSFRNISKWKNAEVILANYNIYVYRRPGFEFSPEINSRVILVEAPLLQLSATHIRKMISEGKSIRYMVPEKVFEEIQKGRYYRSENKSQQ